MEEKTINDVIILDDALLKTLVEMFGSLNRDDYAFAMGIAKNVDLTDRQSEENFQRLILAYIKIANGI